MSETLCLDLTIVGLDDAKEAAAADKEPRITIEKIEAGERE